MVKQTMRNVWCEVYHSVWSNVHANVKRILVDALGRSVEESVNGNILLHVRNMLRGEVMFPVERNAKRNFQN